MSPFLNAGTTFPRPEAAEASIARSIPRLCCLHIYVMHKQSIFFLCDVNRKIKLIFMLYYIYK
jgi:hypothetical protein